MPVRRDVYNGSMDVLHDLSNAMRMLYEHVSETGNLAP
jgi:hypothetical protein